MSSTTTTRKLRRSSSPLPPQRLSVSSDLSQGDRKTTVDAPQVLSARAGDHHSVHRLLLSVLQRPTQTEFHAQLDDPAYEPTNRLIAERADRVVGHALMTPRKMHLGGEPLPVTLVQDVAIAPEYRQLGLEDQILRAMNRRLAEQQSTLGMLCTDRPAVYQRHGWHVCLRHSYSVASAREILSLLGERAEVAKSPLQLTATPLCVRIWRHVEQAALTSLYESGAQGSFGVLERDDDYWRWLVSRHGYDHIYIAVLGNDKLELDDIRPIVGYAVVSQGRILELVAPSCPAAAEALLARACRDAIEQDIHHVRLDAAPHDPLHHVMVDAGGRQHYHEADNGIVFMVRPQDPQALLQTFESRIISRAKDAKLSLPLQLGVVIDGEPWTLSVNRRRVRLASGRRGRSYLECDAAGWVQLLMGHSKIQAAMQAGRLAASTRVAAELAHVLFPPLPFWRPPWDEMPAT